MSAPSDVLQGAAAFMALMASITAVSDATCTPDDDEFRDGRDYRAMSALVLKSLRTDLQGVTPGHAEGYLRALTDLLCIVGDGHGPSERWDPIRATAHSFGEPYGAQEGTRHA